jgi:hypothetical protein
MDTRSLAPETLSVETHRGTTFRVVTPPQYSAIGYDWVLDPVSRRGASYHY